MAPPGALAFALAVALLGFAPPRGAVAQEGTVPIALRLPASARALGLGDAFVAGGAEPDGLFYNPALAAGASGGNASFGRYGDAARLLTLSVAVPLRTGGLALGGRSLEFRSESPNPALVIDDGDLFRTLPHISRSFVATVAWARPVGPLHVGAAGKLLRRAVGPETGTAAAADIGAAWAGRHIVLGAAIQNLGPDLRIDYGAGSCRPSSCRCRGGRC